MFRGWAGLPKEVSERKKVRKSESQRGREAEREK